VVDSGGNSDSLEQTIIVDHTPPEAPLAPVVVNPRSGGRLSLSWTAVPAIDVDGYYIYRSDTAGAGYAQVATSHTLQYADRGLVNGQSYYYVVSAVDTAGNISPHSAETSGTPTAESDLALGEIEFTPDSPVLGREATIQVTILNNGPATATVGVGFYLGGGASGTLISVDTVTVRDGSSASANCLWVPKTGGVQPIEVRIEGSSAIDTTPDNNVASTQAIVNIAPVAEAGADKQGDWNSEISFNGTGSQDVDGLITGYLWDFGDGTTEAHGVTSHIYLAPGTYTATLTVTDNRGAASQNTCTVLVDDTRADVIIADLSWTPVDPQERDTVSITATVLNQGNGPTLFGFFTTFYIDGVYAGYQRVNDLLDIGASLDVIFEWTATKGLHSLEVVADDIQNNVVEINEANNSAGTALTLQQIYFPDLTISELACDVSDLPLSSEKQLVATATVYNSGTADAFDFWVSLYQDNELVARQRIHELLVGATRDVTFQFQPTEGNHDLHASADDPVSQVLESDETNNGRGLAISELTLAYPDLTIEAIRVLPAETTLSDGTSFDISADIRNSGDVDTEHTFKVSFYLDGDYVGDREIRYLPAGAVQTVAFQTRATSGIHVAEVIVDQTGVIAETEEDNNSADFDIPEITMIYPDLIVSDVQWVPTNVTYGKPVDFTCTVSNTTVVSTLDTFAFALYVDDIRIAVQELPRLSGHSSHTFVLNWRADVDPEVAHTVTAVIDTLDEIVEEDEANNTQVIADGTFNVADSFAVELEALNAGLDDFGMRFYLSSMVAEFVSTVSRGSAGNIPVGPEDFIESRITVIKAGGISINAQGEPVQEPDEVILDAQPMSFSVSDRTFRTSLDLINYGTGNYTVTVEAGDGVDSGSAFLTMTVIEEAIFTLTTDKEVYFRGDEVHITGTVTTLDGNYLSLQTVMIMISEGGGGLYPELSLARKFFDSETRTFETRTDPFGNIDFTFRPNWGDAGLFSADALVTTRVLGNAGHSEFTILAAEINPSKLHVTTSTNSSFAHVYTVSNIGDDPLTGVELSILDEDPGDNVTAALTHEVGETLEPGEKAPVTLTVTIPEDAPNKVAFWIILNTAEGYQESARIRFTLLPAQPLPHIEPVEVKIGLNPGSSHTETITLTNGGMGTMTDITLVPPDILPWVTLGALPVNELAPGESTPFQIHISAPESLQLGMYSDLITVTDGNVEAHMRLTVEVSSATRGSVSFVVGNDAGQRVDSAEIRLVSREAFTALYGVGQTSTYHNIFYAKSNELDFVNFEDIPVGIYDYSVSAGSHEKVQGEVRVMPQSDAQVVAIELVAAPLTYSWTVTPIIIEDTYDITLSMTYSVEIPKPQFVFLPPWVSVPHELDTDLYDQIMVVNPSLIELHDVTVEVIGADGIKVSSLGQIGTMAPQSSSVLGLHIEPGAYDHLDGRNTFLKVTGTYVVFDPLTLEPLEEETEVKGKIPLVNPEPFTVKAEWEGNIFFLNGTGKLPGFSLSSLPEEKATEVVRLEIPQEATLEREGFDAQLELTNGLTQELVGLSISPRVTDENGLDVTDRFYIVPPELEGISAVDGTSSLGALSTLSSNWILIPGEGLGGSSLDGQSYWVKAVLSYYVDGRLRELQTNSVEITVHPQPKLYLHYYTPRDVLADEPFKLGLLVENEGDGMARNLKIDSGQPEIVENLSGLKLDVDIVGSSFGSTSGDIVRLVLGDILPHSAVNGYRIMMTSLDGTVEEFSAEFSHRAYKGIDINPLILDVSTEIIEHDYLFADAQDPNNCFSLIDRDDDGFPDYLINLTTGLRLPVLIPDNATVTKPATDIDRTLELQLADTAGYVCVILPDPLPGVNLRSITRTGETETTLSGNNYWKANGNVYFVDEVGFVDEYGQRQPESVSYMLDFRAALEVAAVDCVPVEFNILYSSEVPDYIRYNANLNQPQGDSLLTTWELNEPIFYIDIPPTEGQKAAIGITIQNNGVIEEGGLLDVYMTAPGGDPILLETIEIDPLRAFRSHQVIVAWTPENGGMHTLTASLRNDSPVNQYELNVYVNEKPFADAGADFFSQVSAPTTFDGSRSEDADGYIQSLLWNFGDGIWGGGMGPTHVYEHSSTYRVHVIIEDDVGAMSEDVMQVTINEIRPDLLVELITVAPDTPQEGETVSVIATIRNIGVTAVTDNFHTGFYVDGAYQAIETVSQGIGIGQSVDVPFTWAATTGNHLLTVTADDMTDRIDEADEGNNRHTIALYPDQIYFPDLVPESISLSAAPEDTVIWGDPVDIVAAVRNTGTIDAGAFRINFYVDGRYVGHDIVDGLAHEDGLNLTAASLAWVPTAGDHQFEIRVDDPFSHVLELDESNNQYSETLSSPTLVYADLVSADLVVWPIDGEVQHGEPLIVYATVKNDSAVDIPTSIPVALEANERQVAVDTIDGLTAGEEKIFRFTWLPAAGAYRLVVTADSDDSIPEADEENNDTPATDIALNILYPDLLVEEVSVIGEVQLGNDVVIMIKVSNDGNGDAGNAFNSRLLVNGELIGVERMSQNLLAGTYDYWFFDWQVRSADPAQFTARVIVDANEEIEEANEGNNSLSQSFEIQESYIIDFQSGKAVYLDSEDITLTVAVSDSISGGVVWPGEVSVDLSIFDDTGTLVLNSDAFVFENGQFNFLFAAGSLSPGIYSASVSVSGPLQTQSAVLPIQVAEDFEVVVTTDQTSYAVASPIEISGHIEKLDGTPMEDLAVDIAIDDGVSWRVFTTQTLPDGSYQHTFVPSAREGGVYHVTVETTVASLSRQASVDFTIDGLFIELPSRFIDMSANDSNEIRAVVQNVGTEAVENPAVVVTPNGAYSEITVTVEDLLLPVTLSPGESAEVIIRFNVGDYSGEAEFSIIGNWNIGTDGHQTAGMVTLNVTPAAPQLDVDITSIGIGLTPGRSADKLLTISNTGRAELTSLAISDPSLPWIQVIRSDRTSLAPDESMTVIFRISPSSEAGTGTYTDSMVISSSGGLVRITIDVTITTHALTDLLLQVTNDLEFVVADAEIVLWRIDTEFEEGVGETIADRSRYMTGYTDNDGRLFLEHVLAGTYGYSVNAEYHDGLTAALVVDPGMVQTETTILSFKPLEISLRQDEATDPLDLGQAQIGVVMAPSPGASMLTDRPGAEFLVLRSGEHLSERLTYLDAGSSRKFRDNMRFSINNLSDQDIENVSLILEGDIGSYLKLYSRDFDIIPQNGSAIVNFAINSGALLASEDLIVDGSIWISTAGQEHFIKFPIRIRVAEFEDLHKGEPYRYVPYSGPWPTGPILYGEDFINTWFENAHLSSAQPTGHSLDNVRLSQDIVMEGEAFHLELSLFNILPDREIQIEKTRVVITDSEGVDVSESFDISKLIQHGDTIVPLEEATGLWQIKPKYGLDLGGSQPEGKAYDITVEVVYGIEGQTATKEMSAQHIVVQPEPAFAARYLVESIGDGADKAVKINLNIENIGAGTARKITVGYPEIELPTSYYVTNPGPLEFFNIAPHEVVASSWELRFLGETPSVASIVSSLSAAELKVSGQVPQLSIDAPAKYEFVSSISIEEDLIPALDNLLEASEQKFQKEIEALGRIYSDMHKVIHTSKDIVEAELIAQVLRGATQIMINTTDVLLSLTTLARPIKTSKPITHPTELINSGKVFDTDDVYQIGVPYLETLAAQLLEKSEAFASLAINSVSLTSTLADLVFNGYVLTRDLKKYEQMLEGLFPFIENENATAADFEKYFRENLTYYRLKPYLLWDAVEGFDATPSKEQIFEMLDSVIQKGGDQLDAKNFLVELQTRVSDTKNLLGQVSDEANAVFPVDLLYNEIVNLTKLMQELGTGIGISEQERAKFPSYWYSVGDPNNWYPVFLQDWDFGTLSDHYIDFYQLDVLQWKTLRGHWELLASEFLIDAVMGPLSSLDIMMSSPLAPFFGLAMDVWMDAIWKTVTQAYQNAYADLRLIEHAFSKKMSEIMLRFLTTHQYESAGLWQMFSDIENHIDYIIEHNPIDPDVSVSVDSLNFSDIQVDEGQIFGAGMAEMVVTNDCDLSLKIKPFVRVTAGDKALKVFEGTEISVAPGETGISGVLLALPRTVLFGNAGYDAEIIFDAYDPVTLSREQIGPFHAHFNVGTEEDLIYLDQQIHSVPIGGKIGNEENFEKTMAVDSTANELKITMLHTDGADLDLHLYDPDNRHVGFSLSNGGDEILIPNSEFSGSDSARQIISVKLPAPGIYRIVVEVNDADSEELFTVSVLEIPVYGALFETSTGQIDIETNESEFDIYFDTFEWGGSTGVSSINASMEPLANESGDPLDIADVEIDIPETELQAGGSAEIAVHMVLGDLIEDGIYSGNILVSGIDNRNGLAVTQPIHLSVRIDRQGPDAPQLIGPSQPAEVLPIALTGAAEPNAKIEFFLDDEYAGEVEADELGEFLFDGLLVGLGDHVVQARAIDRLGNASELSAPITVISNVDPFSPLTEIFLSGEEGDNGWFTSEVNLELTAEDIGGSGVQKTEIAIDEGEWAEYTGPVMIATEGIAKVSFRSTDNAGNEEITRSIYVNIDTLTPESSVNPLPDMIEDTTEFTVSWDGSDTPGGSELASYDIYVSTDNDPYELWLEVTTDTTAIFTGERGHTYSFYSKARDNAGNVEAAPSEPDAMTEIPGRPPEFDLGPDAVIDEGETFSRDGSFEDPDTVDNWTGTADFGDGSGEQPLLLDEKNFQLGHVYADDGEYVVTVTITDSYEKSRTELLTVTVNNVPPVAADDDFATDEDTSLSVDVSDLLANDSDAGSDVLTVSGVGDPANGTVVLEADGSVLFTPDENFNGSGSFTYQISDGDGGTDTASVSVTVHPINDTPTNPFGIADIEVNEDIANLVFDLRFLFDDIEDDPADLVRSVSNVSNPDLFNLIAIDNTEDDLTLSLAANISGDSTITVRAIDTEGAFVETRFTVTALNLPPVVEADSASLTVPEGSIIGNTGTFSDPGADDVTITASIGDLTENGDGTWSWSFGTEDGPDQSQTVTVTAADSEGAASSTTFDLTVDNVVPAIVATNASVTVEEGETATNSGTFSDPGEDTLTLAASIGAVIDNKDGTWSWTFDTADGPDQSQTVTITATDSDGAETSTTFELTVDNVAPTVAADSDAVIVNESAMAARTGTFSDPGADTVSLSASIGTINQGDGTWNWTFNTTDGPDDSQTVTITATDSDGAWASIDFNLVVENVAPTVRADHPLVTLPEGSIAGNTGIFGDPGADIVSISASVGTVTWNDGKSTWGWLFFTADGPDESQSVIITATDSDGEASSTTFQLTVDNVAPDVAANNASVTVYEGQTATNSGMFSDPGEDTLTLAASIGAVIDNNDGTWSWTFDTADGPDQSQTVTITATDSDGAATSTTFELTVDNVAPEVAANTNSVTVDESDTAINTGTFSDPGEDSVTVTASIGTISQDDGTWNWTFDTEDGPDQTQTVTITATDSDGAFSTVTFELVVDNIAPEVSATNASGTVDEGETASNTGIVSDVGDDTIALSASVGVVTSNDDGTWSWTFDTADGPDQSQTVTITAIDSDGAASSTTFELVVENVAPDVAADWSVVTVEEGITAENTGTYSDMGEDAVSLSATIGEVITSADGTWSWSFETSDGPDESQVITITATDSDGAATSTTFELIVDNVAPTVAADSDAVTVDEGETAINTGNFSDPGVDAISLSASLGTVTDTGNGTWSWLFDTADGPDQTQTVTITATDSDGAESTAAFELTVDNVAPSVSADNALVMVDEAESAMNSGTFSDPGEDIVTITASIGTISQNNGTWSWSFETSDGPDDSQLVTVTATDSEGAVASTAFDLTVNNVAPTVAADSDEVTVDEGDTAENTGTFSDPGVDTVTVTASIGTISQGAGTWSWSFATTDGPDESQTVEITAIDSDGAENSIVFDLDVLNVAPVLEISGDLEVDVGTPYRLRLVSNDPGEDTITQWTIDWGDGTASTVPGYQVETTHVFNEGPTEHTITATALDEDGTFMANTIDVSVTESAAPVMTEMYLLPPVVAEEEPVVLHAAFEGFNDDSVVHATIDWGDGTVDEIKGLQSSDHFEISHIFAEGSLHDIQVTVSDADGRAIEGTVTAVVTGVGVAEGVLYVAGSTGGDNIVVNRTEDGSIEIQADFLSGAQLFDAALIEHIHIVLGDGDDTVEISDDITLSISMDGGAGNDLLIAGGGAAQLNGGEGNDTIIGSTADDEIHGGDGRDLIIGRDGNDLLHGGADSDLIIGSAGNDVIDGGTGNDVLLGLRGDDEIWGGDGADWLSGGQGSDLLDGGKGDDRLIGGSGDDEILGGEGNDWAFGCGGDDILSGGMGNDILFGGSGNDELTGDDGRDLLFGGSGKDSLDGGAGCDLLIDW